MFLKNNNGQRRFGRKPAWMILQGRRGHTSAVCTRSLKLSQLEASSSRSTLSRSGKMALSRQPTRRPSCSAFTGMGDIGISRAARQSRRHSGLQAPSFMGSPWQGHLAGCRVTAGSALLTSALTLPALPSPPRHGGQR